MHKTLLIIFLSKQEKTDNLMFEDFFFFWKSSVGIYLSELIYVS